MGEENSSIMSDQYAVQKTKGSPSWQLPVLVVLAVIALAALGFAWSNSAKIESANQAVAEQMKSVQASVQQEMTTLKEHVADENTHKELQGDFKVVTDKLNITQSQLKKARREAEAQNVETTNLVKALDTSMHSELATKATADEVKAVDGRVTKVSADLDKTVNDLNMARSELGTLIARNHEDIEVLRRLGERDYIEFTIVGKNKPQNVGNITVKLKSVNEKQNRTNLNYTVEDKKYEAKKTNINSPIFFYLSGARQPEEIVINRVGKNTISGYLSIPKANSQPASNSAANSGLY
jgi:hypothetical protein